MDYHKKGMVQENVGAIIYLIMGVGVATLVLIFVGVLGGQVYGQVEADIDAISNDTIKEDVKSSIMSGFEALKLTGDYLPIVVLAVIIFVVLALVMSLNRAPAYAAGAL